MKAQMKGFMLVLVGSAMFAGGCAKEEMVKKDEGVAPVAAAKPAPVTPAKVDVVKPEPVKVDVPQTTRPAAVEQLKQALEAIYFDFDASGLSSASRTTLAKNAELLKKDSAANVRIEGNCDERGSDEYNLALGERRAKAAAKYLITLGVAENRISTISYGKEKPADPGHNEAAWAKNRRDEFLLNAK
ncbi:MAG: peptidoglycan-associated lipoprotein [Geobacter sp.]|nr:MAG: peptidoglycan-associated lipoprotein [Geobacter sp.]